jgi:hypothetical protein
MLTMAQLGICQGLETYMQLDSVPLLRLSNLRQMLRNLSQNRVLEVLVGLAHGKNLAQKPLKIWWPRRQATKSAVGA